MNTPVLLLASLLLAACGSSSATTPDDAGAPDLARPIGADTTVTILDGVTHKSGEVTKGPFSVTLPPAALYAKITLHVELTCPAGGCDPYDRIASIRLVQGATRLEVGRYITPFGVKGAWDIDVTDLAPALAGAQVFESYIETWSKGWVVSATLDYQGGVPSPEPVSVTGLPWERLPVGDPMKSVDVALKPFDASLAGGATSAKLRLLVTGHGQGNSDNCAEFCDLLHSVLVDDQAVDTRSLWRADCADNPINKQNGTWQYPREGWCPGDAVQPWTIDLGARGAPFRIRYGTPGYDDGAGAVDPYDNTCRPDHCTRMTCTLGTGCDYDGGAHTDPNFFVSAALIGYR